MTCDLCKDNVSTIHNVREMLGEAEVVTRKCTDCHARSQPDGFSCSVCGKWDYQSHSSFKLEGMCFSCRFWQKYITEKNDPRYVRIDHHHYVIGKDETGNRQWSGFGGRRFDIYFNDGRYVTSHNLWAQGQIPKHFWEVLPDNASFTMGERWVEVDGIKYMTDARRPQFGGQYEVIKQQKGNLLCVRTCSITGQEYKVGVTQDCWDRWKAGERIQNVWPELSADAREFLMTGSTPAEWDRFVSKG